MLCGRTSCWNVLIGLEATAPPEGGLVVEGAEEADEEDAARDIDEEEENVGGRPSGIIPVSEFTVSPLWMRNLRIDLSICTLLDYGINLHIILIMEPSYIAEVFKSE